jgi:hypothetical protein
VSDVSREEAGAAICCALQGPGEAVLRRRVCRVGDSGFRDREACAAHQPRVLRSGIHPRKCWPLSCHPNRLLSRIDRRLGMVHQMSPLYASDHRAVVVDVALRRRLPAPKGMNA